MATLGNYETVRELDRSGLATVFAARLAGAEAEPAFVVKELRPLAGMLDEEQTELQTRLFVEGARTQQEVASTGAAHWAPIHQIGSTPHGAFYVTDWYPRSAGQLIRGRVRLPAAALRAIMLGVVEGLRELREACGVSHGKLTPGNVLIGGDSALAGARVALSDPLAAQRDRPPNPEAADVLALGELLYSLVMLQPPKASGGALVAPAKPWSRLGRYGQQWRDLCAEMLDHDPADRPALDEVAARLAALAERRLAAWKLWAAVGAAILVLAAGAAVALRPASRQPAEGQVLFDPARWDELCTESYAWFGLLTADVREGRCEAWRAEPHLSEVMETIEQAQTAGTELDPRAIADSRTDLEYLAVHPTDEAQTGRGPAATQEALAVVGAVKQALSPEAWPLLARMRDLAEGYSSRGWRREAHYVASLVAGVLPGPDVRIAAGADELLAGRALIEAIEERWAGIELDRKELEATGDDCLAQFGDFVMARTASSTDEGMGRKGDLIQLQSDLDVVGDLAARLARVARDDWPTRIDQQQFRQARALTDDPRRPATAETFHDWLDAVQAYYKLPQDSDPRDELGRTLAETKAEIEELRVEYAMEPPEETAGELAKMEAEIDALQAVAWIGLNETRVNDTAADLRSRLRILRLGVQRSLADRRAMEERTLEEYKTDLRRRTEIASSGSDVVNELWRERRDDLLANVAEYEDLHRKATGLEEFLVGLDEQLPGSLEVRPGAPQWTRALLVGEAARRRERTLADILAAVQWDAGAPAAQDDQFAGRRDELVAASEAWRQQATDLAADFGRIEQLLDAAYGFDEADQGGVSPGAIYAKWEQSPIFQDEGVRTALAPVADRVAELRGIDRLQDRTRLVALAKGSTPEAAWAAWRRTGELPWPAQHQTLLDERSVRENLRSILARLQDGPRRASLTSELDAAGAARWVQHVRTVSGPEDMEAAVELMDEFDVDRTGLAPWIRYNVLLCDVRRGVADRTGGDEAVLLRLVEQFRSDVAALPEVSGRADVSAFLQALADVEEQGASGAELNAAGPGAVGWQAAAAQDGESVQYSWQSGGRGRTLTFLRVAPDSGDGRPFYLSSAEVSVGLFLDVLRGQERLDEASSLLKDYDPTQGDDREGPRVWELRRARGGPPSPARSATWLFLPPEIAAGGAYYPAGLDPGRPTDGHPMQQVSAAAALYFARTLGCRLPASAEWLSAYHAELRAGQPTLWNSRDLTWQRQRDYIDSQMAPGTHLEWPDAGTFVPEALKDVVPARDTAASSTDADDGTLWFAEVDSGPGALFTHIVGNVAEYACDDPDGFEQAFKDPSSLSTSAVTRYVRENAGRLCVIGGSALSAEEVKVDTPYPVSSTDPRRGYSDVGFRLAFTAPVEPLRIRLGKLLSAHPYIAEET